MTFKPHTGHIILAFEYYCDSSKDHGDNKFTRRDLFENGIISDNKGYSDAEYVLTELGRVWVKRMMEVPLPKKVIRYE